jgi:hypothetical protein
MTPGILRISFNDPAIAFLSIPVLLPVKIIIAFQYIRHPAAFARNFAVPRKVRFPVN